MTVASLSQNAGYISPEKIKPAESGEVSVIEDLQSIGSFGDPNESPVGKSLPGATIQDAQPDGLFDGEPVASVSRKEAGQNTQVMTEEDYNRQLEASLRAAMPQTTPQTPEACHAPSNVYRASARNPCCCTIQCSKIYIQAGAFGRPENAQRVSQNLQVARATTVHQIDTARGTLYKVKVGPFLTKPKPSKRYPWLRPRVIRMHT